MSADSCPDLEVLFSELADGKGDALEHAQTCPACSAVLEEHRQLEKDLLRIQDPLPPADFLQRVMAKVDAEPIALRQEAWTATGIVSAALAACIGIVVTNEAALGELGLNVAAWLSTAKSLFVALLHGLSALWTVAAVPLTAGILAVMMVSLFGLKRLAGPEAKA